MTIEERAKAIARSEDIRKYEDLAFKADGSFEFGYMVGATEQKEIDEADPSDAVIMRVLNAIGYEEESWLPVVKERLKSMKEHGQDRNERRSKAGSRKALGRA